jgi:hypothetical protein
LLAGLKPIAGYSQQNNQQTRMVAQPGRPD